MVLANRDRLVDPGRVRGVTIGAVSPASRHRTAWPSAPTGSDPGRDPALPLEPGQGRPRRWCPRQESNLRDTVQEPDAGWDWPGSTIRRIVAQDVDRIG